MNLPNKLTLFRVLLIVPVVVLLLLFGDQWWANLAAALIFVGASVTDLLDGRIARKQNLVTNFGKFMDPLADKLLVCSALVCLVFLGRIPAWVVIVIIAREFIISGFRLVAAEQGVVIAASILAKVKTVFQMIMVIALVLDLPAYLVYSNVLPDFVVVILQIFVVIYQILIYATLVLTVASLVEYIIKNRNVMKGPM